MSVRALLWPVLLVVLCSGAVAVPQPASAQSPLVVTPGPGLAHPGDAVLLVVKDARLFATVEGRAFDKAIVFWPSGDSGEWHALAAIPLDTAPRRYDVTIRAQAPDGGTANGHVTLQVHAKRFETRRLRVGDRFVDPPAAEGQRIAQEAARLASLFAQYSPRLWHGPFAAPVPGAATSSFGRLTIMNGQSRGRHQGADFRAATGTPVAAPNAGRVVLAADLYFAGKTVVLDHGAGLFSLFAHLSEISAVEGSVVRLGDRLGLAGATGRVTGPHLHWAMRLGDVSVDPLSVMRAIAGSSESARILAESR